LRAAPEPVGAQAIGPLFALSGLMVTGAPRLAEEPAEDPAEREKRLTADPLLGKKAALKLPPPPKRTGLLALLGNSYLVSEVRPQQGGLTLENLAEIAGVLRDTQVETLMFAAMELGSDSFMDYMTLAGSAGILRLYGKLSPVQRRQLQAGRPLPVRGMLPQQ